MSRMNGIDWNFCAQIRPIKIWIGSTLMEENRMREIDGNTPIEELDLSVRNYIVHEANLYSISVIN